MRQPGRSWSAVMNKHSKTAAVAGMKLNRWVLEREESRLIGHGVGSELDEPPLLAPKMNFPLKAGMVVAVELESSYPGLVLLGWRYCRNSRKRYCCC